MLEPAKSVSGIAASTAIICATALTAAPAANAQPGYQYGTVQTVDWHPKKKGNWKKKTGKHGNWKHYGGYHDNDWVGPAIGFGAGVLFGSILAQPYYYRYSAPRYVAPGYGYYGYPNADAYCHAKYRSYNSYTKTYTGYDGKQHYCRIP